MAIYVDNVAILMGAKPCLGQTRGLCIMTIEKTQFRITYCVIDETDETADDLIRKMLIVFDEACTDNQDAHFLKPFVSVKNNVYRTDCFDDVCGVAEKLIHIVEQGISSRESNALENSIEEMPKIKQRINQARSQIEEIL